MLPVLFKFDGIALHTYGILLASGFLMAVLLAVREARRVGIDPNRIMDLSFYVLVAAIVGSLVFYVITNWGEFRDDPVSVVFFWRGGLVFYGGLIFAFAAGLWYVRNNRLPFRRLADLTAPSIALGQALGRLGCFAAGCCFGAPASVPWAVTFRDPESLAPQGVPLHPAQLYESAAAFAIFFILRRMRLNPKYEGKIFWFYLFFYSTSRYIIEFYRNDPRGWVIPDFLSSAQAVGWVTIPLALYMLLRRPAAPAKTGKN